MCWCQPQTSLLSFFNHNFNSAHINTAYLFQQHAGSSLCMLYLHRLILLVWAVTSVMFKIFSKLSYQLSCCSKSCHSLELLSRRAQKSMIFFICISLLCRNQQGKSLLDLGPVDSLIQNSTSVFADFNEMQHFNTIKIRMTFMFIFVVCTV